MSDSDVLRGNDAPVDLVPIKDYICTTCRQPFPQTAQFFSPIKTHLKNGTVKHGFMTKCRPCERKRVHDSRQKQILSTSWIEEAAEKGIKLWERQPNESAEAFECFAVFRSLYMPGHKRPTVNMVAEKVNKGFAAVTHHSRNWRWAVRLDAYIAELDRNRLAEEEESRREMLRRHIQTAIDVQKKATDALEHIDANELNAKEVIQFIDTAIKIERQARMDATAGTMQDSNESTQVNNVQININTDQNQSNLAGILSILERSGALATVMGEKKTEVVDVYPPDEDGVE